MQMAIISKGSGEMTEKTGTEFILIKMERSTRGSGKMV